jgi:hypothetical protein
MNEHEAERPQNAAEIVAAAMKDENLIALVAAFHGHRQSIREHEESRRPKEQP